MLEGTRPTARGALASSDWVSTCGAVPLLVTAGSFTRLGLAGLATGARGSFAAGAGLSSQSITDNGAAVFCSATDSAGRAAHMMAPQNTGQTPAPMALLPLQGDGLADFLRRGGKVDAQFRPNIGKAHKPDESDNHKDKQKLEEFA